MKTTAYLRWSLLIPFMMWVICLLSFMGLSTIVEWFDKTPFESTSFGIVLFLGFYVFGVIFWIIPYLLLASILFFWSLIGKAQVLLKAFALSPIAMMLLTVSIIIVLGLGNTGTSWALSREGIDPNFTNFNLLVAAMAFLWGYICVGIGYGTYKWLKRRNFIRDEQVVVSSPSVTEQGI